MVCGTRTSFPIQLNPVQYPHSPPESFGLDMRIGLRGQTNVRVPRQLLHRERIFGLVTENPFAPGLRPAVTSCPNLALPVQWTEGLTD